MDNFLSVDSTLMNSYLQVRDYLYKQLKDVVKENRSIIFLCIGSDRSTGDSLGPLIGHKLRHLRKPGFYIYGTLDNPIHSKNLNIILARIKENFTNPYIIAIDACLGKVDNIGKVHITNTPLHPGAALNRELPSVGEMSITGIVNIAGNFEYIVLQSTRLLTVMTLADCISAGIYHFILKSSQKSYDENDPLNDIFAFPNN